MLEDTQADGWITVGNATMAVVLAFTFPGLWEIVRYALEHAR